MSSPPVRQARPADRERVVGTVTAAFARDQAFRHFFGQSYAAEAPTFAGNLFDVRLAWGTVWVVDDGSAVSMWNPPDAASFDVSAGLSAPTRARMDRYDAAVHAITPAQPYWYLGVLATHPDRAGQRWGRLAMAQGLARARQDGVPAYLETATATNVAIYTGSGWTVVATVTLDELEVSVLRHDG